MSSDQTIKTQTIATPITLPTRTERRYLATFGLGAVIVFVNPSGSRVSIQATDDCGEALTAMRRKRVGRDGKTRRISFQTHH